MEYVHPALDLLFQQQIKFDLGARRLILEISSGEALCKLCRNGALSGYSRRVELGSQEFRI